MKNDPRASSYLNHLAYIDEKPPPNQIQYMNYTHSVAWSFSKGERRKYSNTNILKLKIFNFNKFSEA